MRTPLALFSAILLTIAPWGPGTAPTDPAAPRVPMTSAPRYDLSVIVTDSQIAIAADISLPPSSAQRDSLVFSLAEVMTNVSADIVAGMRERNLEGDIPQSRLKERVKCA